MSFKNNRLSIAAKAMWMSFFKDVHEFVYEFLLWIIEVKFAHLA